MTQAKSWRGPRRRSCGEENYGVNNMGILENAHSLPENDVSGDIGCSWWFCGGLNSVYVSYCLIWN